MTVTHLRSVAIGTPDVEALREFYVEPWGLTEVATADGVTYLRGRGPEHHVMTISAAAQPRLVGYELGVADADAVDRLHEHVTGLGVVVVTPPAELDEPGGGYGMTISDPDGRLVRLTAAVAAHPEQPARARVAPVKLSHVVLNSPVHDEFSDFLVDALGFALADELPHMTFFRCNTDHHSVAVSRAPHASLNHVAFEVATVDDVLRGVQEVAAPMVWGPNRHGPGHNAFGYFTAPNGQVIEYTAEIEQIDLANPPAPKQWRPDEVAVVDDWAEAETLRPTPATREQMLGNPESPLVEPSRLAAPMERNLRAADQ